MHIYYIYAYLYIYGGSVELFERRASGSKQRATSYELRANITSPNTSPNKGPSDRPRATNDDRRSSIGDRLSSIADRRSPIADCRSAARNLGISKSRILGGSDSSRSPITGHRSPTRSRNLGVSESRSLGISESRNLGISKILRHLG